MRGETYEGAKRQDCFYNRHRVGIGKMLAMNLVDDEDCHAA
jgi:hypothetical protein